SVRYQSFQEFEIIVVDDGSEDQEGTRKSIEALNDPRISFYAHSESRGVA
ncbi:glycosyltransferase, partial [Escherichia coli]|nr:glycosyltransferase [Escherichia coli]